MHMIKSVRLASSRLHGLAIQKGEKSGLPRSFAGRKKQPFSGYCRHAAARVAGPRQLPDKISEAAVIDILKTAYPDHTILAEEPGRSDNESEFQWIIDPLDGTINFIHGFQTTAYRSRSRAVV